MEKIDPKKSQELLNVVSKKLGVPPETLRKQLEEGKFDAALNNMGKKDADKLRQVMNNPKLVEKIISTPQAQALYKKLTEGK